MPYIGAGIQRFNTADELTVTGDAQIDTTTLVVDSTNNRVGVGTASPATALDVTGTVTADGLTVDSGANALTRTSSGAEVDALELRNNATATDTATTLKFANSTAAGSNSGSTELVAIRTGTNTGDFVVRVADSTPAMQERLRIDSSGNMLVGTTDTVPSNNGASGDAGAAISPDGVFRAARSGNVSLDINRMDSDGEIAAFRKDGTTVGSIASRAGVVSTLILNPASSNGAGLSGGTKAVVPADEAGIVDNDISLGVSTHRFKDLYLSGGAYLGGTGSANHLDDYEEGTFTPAFTSTGASFSYSVQLGSYVKIGQLVCCWFNITLSASPSGTTSNQLTFNVPFATNNVDNSLYSGGHIGHYFNINLGSGTTIAYQLPSASATQIELKEVGDNIGENGIVASELNTSAVIRGSVMYRAAS
jgi:hypothetical protein